MLVTINKIIKNTLVLLLVFIINLNTSSANDNLMNPQSQQARELNEAEADSHSNNALNKQSDINKETIHQESSLDGNGAGVHPINGTKVESYAKEPYYANTKLENDSINNPTMQAPKTAEYQYSQEDAQPQSAQKPQAPTNSATGDNTPSNNQTIINNNYYESPKEPEQKQKENQSQPIKGDNLRLVRDFNPLNFSVFGYYNPNHNGDRKINFGAAISWRNIFGSLLGLETMLYNVQDPVDVVESVINLEIADDAKEWSRTIWMQNILIDLDKRKNYGAYLIAGIGIGLEGSQTLKDNNSKWWDDDDERFSFNSVEIELRDLFFTSLGLGYTIPIISDHFLIDGRIFTTANDLNPFKVTKDDWNFSIGFTLAL